MFDRAGNYAQIIVGSESRVFGAKTFCAFGTYTVDEAKKHSVDHTSLPARPRSSPAPCSIATSCC